MLEHLDKSRLLGYNPVKISARFTELPLGSCKARQSAGKTRYKRSSPLKI